MAERIINGVPEHSLDLFVPHVPGSRRVFALEATYQTEVMLQQLLRYELSEQETADDCSFIQLVRALAHRLDDLNGVVMELLDGDLDAQADRSTQRAIRGFVATDAEVLQ